MSREFENATNRIADMGQKLDLFMSTCQRCGRCFKGAAALDELKMKGYRSDDIAHERWVYGAHSFMESEPAADDIQIELD